VTDIGSYSFTVNGEDVTVRCPGSLRVLWVLRDILGIHGPKYGCGLDVCKACTSHIDGQAFNPCSVEVQDVVGHDITTIEGLPATVGAPLHPIQEFWVKHDVAQCGYCQPGQIMAAVALVDQLREEQGGVGPVEVSDAALDGIRNVCRCGTYYRIRQAIRDYAASL
jgi:isoquinoline 1-oxidoreductase alpha subunit